MRQCRHLTETYPHYSNPCTVCLLEHYRLIIRQDFPHSVMHVREASDGGCHFFFKTHGLPIRLWLVCSAGIFMWLPSPRTLTQVFCFQKLMSTQPKERPYVHFSSFSIKKTNLNRKKIRNKNTTCEILVLLYTDCIVCSDAKLDYSLT